MWPLVKQLFLEQLVSLAWQFCCYSCELTRDRMHVNRGIMALLKCMQMCQIRLLPLPDCSQLSDYFTHANTPSVSSVIEILSNFMFMPLCVTRNQTRTKM